MEANICNISFTKVHYGSIAFLGAAIQTIMQADAKQTIQKNKPML
jgi:hypothetical protein